MHCKACDKNFRLYSPESIQKLSWQLQDQIPCQLSYKAALGLDVIRLMEAGTYHSLKISGIRSIIKEYYTLNFWKRCVQYYKCVEDFINLQRTAGYQRGVTEKMITDSSQVPLFPTFTDVYKSTPSSINSDANNYLLS